MIRNIRHILLIEANSNEREMFQIAFDQIDIPHEISFFVDSQQAIDYLLGESEFTGQGAHPIPDVIFLDLKLPKLDGFKELELIRSNPISAYTPVVVFTSSNMQTDILAGYKLGANSVVTKPVNGERLIECIRYMGTYWLAWNYPPPTE